MTMFKSLMLAFAVLFSGLTFATDSKTDCPEGSEAPECQTQQEEGSNTSS